MRWIRGKGGFEMSQNLVVFLILNVLFFSLLFVVVVHFGSNASFYEQVNAKKIALLIDGSEPGTSISLNLDEFMPFVEDKKVNIDEIVSISDNKVIVKLAQGKGYSFEYFSDYEVDYSLEVENGLFLNILILGAENE